MSFSGDVKKELLAVLPSARHCQLAELAAGVLLLAEDPSEEETLILRTENEGAANKLFTLLKKAFNIDIVVNRRRGSSGGKHGWTVSVEDADAAAMIRKTRLILTGHTLEMKMIIQFALRQPAGWSASMEKQLAAAWRFMMVSTPFIPWLKVYVLDKHGIIQMEKKLLSSMTRNQDNSGFRQAFPA